MRRILHTTEPHARSNCEAGTVFKRARVGDALVDAEAHLLLVVRVVRKHLLREHDRRRGGDYASVEIEFDLVGLHVLPHEAEELVCVKFSFAMVDKGGVHGRTRDQRQALRDDTEVLRVLARARLELEPATSRRCTSDRRSFTDRRVVGLTCLRGGHRHRYAPLSGLGYEKRGPCR